MHGADKGLLRLHGHALIDWIIPRLQPQLERLLINANRHVDDYALRGLPVIRDRLPGFAGPLAGLHTALSHAHTPLVLTVPCDTPCPPADLVARLWHGMQVSGQPLAIAHTEGRPHPVFCLCQRTCLHSLEDFLHAGGRKVLAWCVEQGYARVDFDDQTHAFLNINQPADLADAERALQAQLPRQHR
jgi:molybdopterin-guanine dinucleotide biosynthesis protein A